MSITRQDILDMTDRGNQMSMFEYWSPDDEQQHKDHVGKSVLQMVDEYAETTKQEPDPDLYTQLICEEIDEWDFENNLQGGEFSKHYGQTYNPSSELKELSDLVYVIYGYALARGWDLDEAVRRVHENNMGRMYQPDGTIKRRADGKIEKNKDFPKVNLEDLV